MNQTRPKMVRAYSAATGLQAHVVRSAFEQHDIPVQVRNEMLSSLGGGLPMADTMVEVWIPETHLEQANELLRLLQTPADEPGRLSIAQLGDQHGAVSVSKGPPPPGPQTCPKCGEQSPAEFGECWNCQSNLG